MHPSSAAGHVTGTCQSGVAADADADDADDAADDEASCLWRNAVCSQDPETWRLFTSQRRSDVTVSIFTHRS